MTSENPSSYRPGRIGRLLEELHESSDRAVAIVSAEWLSQLLKKIIASYFIDDSDKTASRGTAWELQHEDNSCLLPRTDNRVQQSQIDQENQELVCA
jgi:hypothetical protein